MDYQALKTELDTDPEGLGYAEMDPVAAAAALNAGHATELTSTFVNARTVLSLFPDPADGEAVLQALEAASDDNGSPHASIYARAVAWMAPSEAGVDVGHAATRSMIDGLAAYGATAPQIAAIKALGERPVSRAEQLGLGRVDWRDVRRARSL